MPPKHRSKTPVDIASLARTYTETAINTLVGIATSIRASDSARVSAAVHLLDRGHGKARAEIIIKDGGKIEDSTLDQTLNEIFGITRSTPTQQPTTKPSTTLQ